MKKRDGRMSSVCFSNGREGRGVVGRGRKMKYEVFETQKAKTYK